MADATSPDTPLQQEVARLRHRVAALEAALDESLSAGFDRHAPSRSFREISFEDVVFHYHDTDSGGSFTVGPINLTLTPGEMVFIAGGNGMLASAIKQTLAARGHKFASIDIDTHDLTKQPDVDRAFAELVAGYHLTADRPDPLPAASAAGYAASNSSPHRSTSSGTSAGNVSAPRGSRRSACIAR